MVLGTTVLPTELHARHICLAYYCPLSTSSCCSLIFFHNCLAVAIITFDKVIFHATHRGYFIKVPIWASVIRNNVGMCISIETIWTEIIVPPVASRNGGLDALLLSAQTARLLSLYPMAIRLRQHGSFQPIVTFRRVANIKRSVNNASRWWRLLCRAPNGR